MDGEDGKNEVTVIEEMVAESVTVTADGMADILYKRTLTNTATGEILVNDVVRESMPVEGIPGIPEFLDAAKAAGSVADGSAKARVTKKQLCKG